MSLKDRIAILQETQRIQQQEELEQREKMERRKSLNSIHSTQSITTTHSNKQTNDIDSIISDQSEKIQSQNTNNNNNNSRGSSSNNNQGNDNNDKDNLPPELNKIEQQNQWSHEDDKKYMSEEDQIQDKVGNENEDHEKKDDRYPDDQESSEDEEDTEEARRAALRERMAKLAGASRFGGGSVGFNPFGMPIPSMMSSPSSSNTVTDKKLKHKQEKSDEENEQDMLPQAIPIMPFADPNALSFLNKKHTKTEENEEREDKPEINENVSNSSHVSNEQLDKTNEIENQAYNENELTQNASIDIVSLNDNKKDIQENTFSSYVPPTTTDVLKDQITEPKSEVSSIDQPVQESINEAEIIAAEMDISKRPQPPIPQFDQPSCSESQDLFSQNNQIHHLPPPPPPPPAPFPSSSLSSASSHPTSNNVPLSQTAVNINTQLSKSVPPPPPVVPPLPNSLTLSAPPVPPSMPPKVAQPLMPSTPPPIPISKPSMETTQSNAPLSLPPSTFNTSTTSGPPVPSPPTDNKPNCLIRRTSTHRDLIASLASLKITLNPENPWWISSDPLVVPREIEATKLKYNVEREESVITKRTGEEWTFLTLYILFENYTQANISIIFATKSPIDTAMLIEEKIIPFEISGPLPTSLNQKILMLGQSLLETEFNTKNFVSDLLMSLNEKVVPPIANRTFGVTVVNFKAGSIFDDQDMAKVVPGDVLVIRKGKLERHGKLVEVGNEDSYAAIVTAYEPEKTKVRVIENRDSYVVATSYKLNTMQSGKLKIFRVIPRQYINW